MSHITAWLLLYSENQLLSFPFLITEQKEKEMRNSEKWGGDGE